MIWALVALAGLGAFVALLLGYGAPPAVVNSGTARCRSSWWRCGARCWSRSFCTRAPTRWRSNIIGARCARGGLMLYFGMPAFFVDTSDIWRSPRRARMLVSAAGPMSDLFVGGLAALLVLLIPGDTLLNSVAYKLAFTCYIATLFNANPLLELDGYYILVDWLRLPDLRRRALEFMRGPLWRKIDSPRPTNDEGRTTKASAGSVRPLVVRPSSVLARGAHLHRLRPAGAALLAGRDHVRSGILATAS